MNAFLRQFRLAALATIVALAPCAASTGAAQEMMAPTYSRTRGGAGDWQSRGWHGGGGWGWGGGYSFVPPFYPQPIVTGSYYQRPYPYHFDYFRHRWGGEQPPAQDCPCAAEPMNGPASTPAP